ncbi:MAG: toxin YdaT domain-containing protein [Oxalobacter formigenes]|nr:toxin YdaT domain-containing protein [Oxalobacter formigenes]
MRHESHKTLIAVLLEQVNAWRKSQAFSRETAAQAIVEAHEATGGPALTGIRFDKSNPDAFARQKAAADRIFRWLDDASKDSNLLPANFIPSILAALPVAYRVAALNELLRPFLLVAWPMDTDGGALDAPLMLKTLVKEQSEATGAVADLVDGVTREELLRASKELSDAISTASTMRAAIEKALRGGQS